ncbi:DUF1573 domain-containing protein [Spirosoma flavum]|uniref:DUF1573 domain-containing protein n=1 Tax=Spirosoma flavum TaxID=2048557 RepID=A0ABW6AQU9_9BACT
MANVILSIITRIKFSVTLLMLLIFFSLFSCSNSITSIFITNETIDLGEIKKANLIKAKFEIKNVGNNELLIKKIYADCICTKVSIEKYEAKPNEVIFAQAWYNNQILGPFQQLIFLEGNTHPTRHILIIKGKVI